jgi:hypothetical protein
MALPTVRTWVASEFVTATTMNGDPRDVENFLWQPPRVSVYKSANQTLTNNVEAVVSFNTELYDPYSTAMHDNATNNSRLVARETGLYTVNLFMIFGADIDGQRQYTVEKNAGGTPNAGTELANAAFDATSATIGMRIFRTFDVPLTSGDYIELFAFHTAGANLDLVGGTQSDTSFQMRWFSKQ